MHILIAIIFSLFLTPSPETCEVIHDQVGGELVEWVGYPQGWILPEDLKSVSKKNKVWIYHSDSESADYVWVFLSYDRTTDSQGNHYGAHEFCGPYKLTELQ